MLKVALAFVTKGFGSWKALCMIKTSRLSPIALPCTSSFNLEWICDVGRLRCYLPWLALNIGARGWARAEASNGQ